MSTGATSGFTAASAETDPAFSISRVKVPWVVKPGVSTPPGMPQAS